MINANLFQNKSSLYVKKLLHTFTGCVNAVNAKYVYATNLNQFP